MSSKGTAMSKKPRKADEFATLLADVKGRIQTSQTRAVLAVNAELVRLYWDIGRIIDARQQLEGWGAAVIPRLAKELKNELPEMKGFSVRNIGLMIRFYRDYPESSVILQPPVAKLPKPPKVPQAAALLERVPISQPPVAKLVPTSKVPQAVAQLADSLIWLVPWAHHVILMQKLNFYCNVVNDRLKHATDSPTIGLILCQSKDKTLAEYSFAGIDKPIGIATYELTRTLPKSVQSALPTVEAIEAELQRLESAPQKKPARTQGGRK